ncbi:hypothetical protein EDD85DRAFT_941184 [Armillaria nabsnona]|nr:hypothetical protein EDD85DRAFT_941184 [Armillaria nabsnona]
MCRHGKVLPEDVGSAFANHTPGADPTAAELLRDSDPAQRAARYMSFNVNSLQEIAYKSVDARNYTEGSYNNIILLKCDNSSRAIARIPPSVIANAHLSRPAESPLYISFAKSSISIIPQKYLPGTHLRFPTLSRYGISPNPSPHEGEQTAGERKDIQADGATRSLCLNIKPVPFESLVRLRISPPRGIDTNSSVARSSQQDAEILRLFEKSSIPVTPIASSSLTLKDGYRLVIDQRPQTTRNIPGNAQAAIRYRSYLTQLAKLIPIHATAWQHSSGSYERPTSRCWADGLLKLQDTLILLSDAYPIGFLLDEREAHD